MSYVEYFIVSTLTFVRVLIPAVSKKTINPKLHIFNNCFDDRFSTRKWILHWPACTYMDCGVYALCTPCILQTQSKIGWWEGLAGNKTQSLHLRHEITCVCLFCLVSLSLWQTIILATAFFARRLKVVLAQDHKSLTGAMNNRSTNHLIGTSVSKPHTIVCSIAIFHNYTGKCGALWGERELCGVFVLHRQLNNCPFQSPSTQSAHIVNVYTGNETAIYRGRTV